MADKKINITDTWLKSQLNKERPETEEYPDRDAMSIRISPKGKVVYQMRYRWDGKGKRLDLGTYPLMSLKEAREENMRFRARLANGENPKTVKLTEKAVFIEEKTLEQLVRLWFVSFAQEKKQSWKDHLRSFEIHVFPKMDDLPALGELPARSLTMAIWLERLEAIAENSFSIADRILSNGKQMYEWAVKRGYVPANVLEPIDPSDDLNLRKGERKRYFDNQEIYMVLLATRGSRMIPRNKILIFLTLFWGNRISELRLAKIEDFDLEKNIWTIPVDNHKTGKITGEPLYRPIIPEIRPYVIQLIELAKINKRKHLFSYQSKKQSERMNLDEPLQVNFHLSMPAQLNQWLLRHRDYELKSWSMHALRKTFRTNMSTITEPHICEVMLGHTLPKIWRTYDFHEYLDEMSVAYKKWFDRLIEIMTDQTLDVAYQHQLESKAEHSLRLLIPNQLPPT